ncbi:predicted protein [Nematostella vectensis]|uniref:G-protein coupled receptors family 1 profile domain-containing protein n=2 Tax=Nematostella vectensis TaxID=45351 RepID=A7SJ28_NEMVE|nr:predicted protein [Nematostella vectensis]|eukprot:XP_001628352.1 predicted protein [Nematostella vectensis]
MELSSAQFVGIGVFYFVLALLAITGNAVTIIAYLKDPFKQLRNSASNLLITALASVDLLNALLSLLPSSVFYILCAYHVNFRDFLAKTNPCMEVMKSTLELASLLLLVAMTTDRHRAVTAPLTYKYHVTITRMRRALIVITCYSVVFGLAIAMTCHVTHYVIHGGHLVLSLVVLMVMNTRMVLAVRRSRSLVCSCAESNACRLAYQRERNITIAVCIILAVFLLTFFPAVLLSTVTVICTAVECSLNPSVFSVSMFISMTSYHTSSVTNPIVYSWRLEKYRHAFRYLLIKCACARVDDMKNTDQATASSLIRKSTKTTTEV